MIARCFAVLTSAVLLTSAAVASAPSALAAEGIVVNVTPSSPHVDDLLVVTATVSGATTPPPSLAVTRTNRDGTQSMFSLSPTGTSGDYSGQDPVPAMWGTTKYVVTDPTTNVTGQASVYVRRLNPRVSIAASKPSVTFGQTVRVTGHLGSATTTRTLTIYARPYELDRKRIARGPVDAQGNLSVSYTMHRRTRFIASFAGDDRYYPTTAYVIVRARAVIHDHLSGFFDTSGGYRIYHSGDSPELDARMFPNLYHACLYFRAQYYSGGAWHRASVSPCVRTDAAGRAAALLNNALALPYRLRAEWRGSTTARAAHGPWRRLRFR